MLRLVVAAAAAAGALAGWPAEPETYPGPASPADQPAWLANLTAVRTEWRNRTSYNASVYDNLLWTSRLFVAPQIHLYDRFLYDREAAMWTVDRFLDDFATRFGQVDGLLLWATYPNMGVDERNQFQILEDLPGGLDGLKSLVSQLTARGVRSGLAYNPWDTGTEASNATDDVVLASIAAAVGQSWINGDTMDKMSEAFWTSSSGTVALQPEGGPSLEGLEWTKMGWGYWPWNVIVDVDIYKWMERRHITQICDRWATDHTRDWQQAFFNGMGTVPWENVWGFFNSMSARDGQALKRVSTLLRFMAPFLTSEQWEPHTILHPAAHAVGVFASRWPAPAGDAFSMNATAWTVVNRQGSNYSGPIVVVPCAVAEVTYYDLYAGLQIAPEILADGSCALNVSLIEAGGYGAFIAVNATDASVAAVVDPFLVVMAAFTSTALASYSTVNAILQQSMTDWGTTTLAPSPPAGMVLIPGNASWLFTVNGTEIEGADRAGEDVQFPWEAVAHKVHPPTLIPVAALYMDVEPVTNAAYATFLTASGYTPTDGHNFVRDWAGGTTYPTGWASKPVTWVDLADSAAYCKYYGKRLPNDWEWQRAAQGDDGRPYPWGSTYDASRVPPLQTGRTRPAPPDVGSYPGGASPYGVMDMMGAVWQWTNAFTDAHTATGLVRGGSYYGPRGSSWYFPNDLTSTGDVRATTHNKVLTMSSSYDRHGAVGFRCVVDAA
jgi:formylglycine-generating enzyme required for sulfatase activity